MAKKEESPKKVLERVYTIPLRRETLKVPPFKKANKAMKAVIEFVSKHMKSNEIAVGKYLNLAVWTHGAKNPPHKLKVNATKDDKGKVFVELVGVPKEEPKAEEKKKPSKAGEKITKEAEFKEKTQEKLESELKESKEEKAEEAKKIEKEEIRELQKEHPKHHAPKMPAMPKQQEAHPTAPKSV
ncbi:60S ribosomal protein L31 [Candidatus Woesearchaeota archaeon]|nr:60S ribosomal protein L31 [Candidatus Woesearchaeota archaeon]